jgi:hypothetical protein
MIKVGDWVVLKQLPPGVEALAEADDKLNTKEIFRECVGGKFRVRAIDTNSPHEQTGHLELWVKNGVDCENEAEAATIWIEPEYVELI